jgi:hypothetical protein
VAVEIQWNGLPERLTEALKHANATKHALHKRLERRGVRGSSWGSIRNYFEGDAQPTLDVLLAMADELGVRLQWLAYDDGEMTAELEAAADRHRRLSESADSGLPDEVRAQAAHRDAVLAGLGQVDPRLQHERAALALYSAMETYKPEELWGEGWPDRVRRHAVRTGQALLAPLEPLGIDAKTMTHEAWTDYVLGMSAILRNAVRMASPHDAGQGRVRVTGGKLVSMVGAVESLDQEPVKRPKPRRAVSITQKDFDLGEEEKTEET